jgi:hypothetical protein
MKTIAKLYDLQEYGFNCLTGEACNLMMRVLVDLDSKAAAVFKDCYGLKELMLDDPRGRFCSDGTVGSVMLPHDAWKSLGIFALLDIAKCHDVLATDDALFGLESNETFIPEEGEVDDRGEWAVTKGPEIKRDGEYHPWPSSYGQIRRRYPLPDYNVPHEGHSNIHQMGAAGGPATSVKL